MPLEQAADLSLLGKAKDAAYHFALFGMTTPQLVDTKVVVTAIVIGVASAYTASYVNAERNAVRLDATISRLDQSNREQAEFRAEIRAVLAARNGEYQAILERQARVEAIMQALHPQGGMGGNGRK
jgi:phenylpropionate dioxygenase-like ring-hydroxylating dioxygenase large terminal subunit